MLTLDAVPSILSIYLSPPCSLCEEANTHTLSSANRDEESRRDDTEEHLQEYLYTPFCLFSLLS